MLGFTPDGEYPLINGEKGILNESYAVQLHQTGAWQLSRVQGGVAGNVVPDYACAVLTAPAGASLPEAEHITVTAIPGGYQVEAVGVSAHGSHPEQGENAIGRLVCYLDRLPLEGDARQAVHFWLRSWAPTLRRASAGPPAGGCALRPYELQLGADRGRRAASVGQAELPLSRDHGTGGLPACCAGRL